MTTVMSPPLPAGRSDWRPGHAPRLSYRNPVPPGEHVPRRDGDMGVLLDEKTKSLGRSIKEIRDATLHENTITESDVEVTYQMAQPEKEKKSIWQKLKLGEEPTKKALDDMRKKETAKHGALVSSNYANVRMQPMPDHVPKVNSRWDGVPDTVKQREKQEKEKIRSPFRGPSRPVNSRSRSSGQDEFEYHRRGSNAASITESWDSYSLDSRPVFYDNISMRPESIGSNSSVNSANQSQQTTPVLSQPYAHMPGLKSSNATSHYVAEASLSPGPPQRWPSSQSVWTQSTTSSDQSRPDRSPRIEAPSFEAIPEYTSSSTTTPERSPQPSAVSLSDAERRRSHIKSNVTTDAPVTRKTSVRLPIGGKSPVNAPRRNSRTGLGFQTSNVIAPWESQVLPSDSPISASHSSSRGRSRFFGREKK